MFIVDNTIFKRGLQSIFYELVKYFDFQWLLDSPTVLHSCRLRDKRVIDFQYFASSIKNMKHIHSSSTNHIGHIFAYYFETKLKQSWSNTNFFLSSWWRRRETNWYAKPHATKSSRNSPYDTTSISLTFINSFNFRNNY